MPKRRTSPKADAVRETEATSYLHPEARSLLRPDVGTQAQFKKKQPPATYRYDSSLSPELGWDGQNGARDLRGAATYMVCKDLPDTANMPFRAGEHRTIAVTVIEDRANRSRGVETRAGAS